MKCLPGLLVASACLVGVGCSSSGGAAGSPTGDGGGNPSQDTGTSGPIDTGPSPFDDSGTTGAPVRTIGDVQNGVATYYTFADGTGACSFDATPNDLDIAALGANQWNNAAMCGGCVKITGPKGSVTVRIVDECGDCTDDWHFDLSTSAFAKIDDVSAGRTPIQWQPVTCDVTGPITYKFKEKSNEYWTAIQIRNHRAPIQSLEANIKGAWTTIQRLDYNYFVYDTGLGAGPYDLRVTDVLGAQIVDPAVPFTGPGTITPSASQFP